MATSISNVGTTFLSQLPGVVETLNRESKVRKLIQTDAKWTGSYREGTLHTAPNTAVGNMTDGGAWRVSGNETFEKWRFYRKFTTASVDVTFGAAATASGTENNAEDVISGRIKRATESVLKFENGMLYRNGDGSIATVQTGTTGTTLLLNDSRMLWRTGTYEVYDSTLATNRGTFVVSSKASAPTAAGYASVTTSATLPTGTTSGDLIVWKDNLNSAITGLDKLVDDTATTFQNVSVTANPEYTSMVLDNSGTNRDLEPTLFRQMLAGIYQKSGKGLGNDGLTVICTAWQIINWEEIFDGDQRLTPRDKAVGIVCPSYQTAFGRIDLMPDYDATSNRMYFIDFTQIRRAEQRKMGWLKGPIEGIFHMSPSSATMYARLLEISELYIKDRRTSGRIEDLTETRKTVY